MSEASTEPSAGDTGDWRDRATERSLRAARAKAESRTERYMQTAIAILSETGRTDFTLQELVERSRTSLRTFYQHFTSKDDLLIALTEEVMQQAAEQWRAAVQGLAAVDALRLVVHKVYGRTLSVQFGGINRALSSFNVYLSEARPEDYGRVLLPLNTLLLDIVRAGMDAGTLRSDLAAEDLTRVLTQCLVGAAQLNAIVPGRPEGDPEVFWQLMLAGLVGAAPAPDRVAPSAGDVGAPRARRRPAR